MNKAVVIAENEAVLQEILSQPFWKEKNIAVQGIYTDNTDKYTEEEKTLEELFDAQDTGFLYMLEKTDDISAIKTLKNNIFEKYMWLSLYADKKSLLPPKKMLENMFELVCELSPFTTNDKIAKVIAYVLASPEGDLRQTSVAESLYINSSYLSTVFTANINIRFVDYVNNVRLRRAAMLLVSTDLKIADIADRLEYRDISYFSKLFKKKFGMTPSLYRIPDNYNYQI